MKNIKNLLIAIAAIVMVIPSLSSCKKGEGDPLLSLHSRKARVAGEWTVNNWKETQTYSNTSNDFGSSSSNTGTSTYEISGNSLTLSSNGTYSSSSGTETSTVNGTGNGTMTFTFDKEGTFKKVIKYENLNMAINSDGYMSNMIYNQTVESLGTWNFLGGVEADYKNKERIILNILQEKMNYSYTEDGEVTTGSDNNTYSNGQYSEIWHINTLKNKEMILDGEMNGTGTSTYSMNFMGTNLIGNSSSNNTGTVKGTLSQK